MKDGSQFVDEFRGSELKWDLATESRRISALFNDLDWPRERLDNIVQTVTGLEDQSRIDPLIQLCVRQ